MQKVTVDHNGSCEGHTFTKDMPVELPESAIAALGNHAKAFGPIQQVVAAVKKQVTPPRNKMVGNAPVSK